MPQLKDLIPDPKVITEMHPGDLAGYVLEFLLGAPADRSKWSRHNGCARMAEGYAAPGMGVDVALLGAFAEAWTWLEVNGLLCEEPTQPDWYFTTRRAKEVSDRQSVRALISSQELPEHFLHPEIVQHSRSLFMQGRLDAAVFEAFKTLEVEIRKAAGLGNEWIGTKLASRAFNATDGALTDTTAEAGEREALMNLMVGAIGSYKNPHSHRRVDLTAADARELLMFASQLLKIVDDRRPR